MRSLSTTAATLALLLAIPAANAEPAKLANPTQIVDEIVAENVSALVTEIGGQQVEVRGSDGKKSVIFRDGGIPYVLTPTACVQTLGKCVGLSMIVLVDNSKSAFSLETLDTANRENGLLSFFREGNDKFVVGRIAVVDGGVTKKNLANEIALFVVSFQEAMKKMSSQTIASVNRPNPYLSATVGGGLPQPILISPEYAARLTESLAQLYGKRDLSDLRRR